jgi:hypothetical protein
MLTARNHEEVVVTRVFVGVDVEADADPRRLNDWLNDTPPGVEWASDGKHDLMEAP